MIAIAISGANALHQKETTTYWVEKMEGDMDNDRSMLRREFRNTMSVQKPFKWQHLDPTFIDQAIADIWSRGSVTARRFYDAGRDDKVKNWVIKWLLWHVCRYRDWRNRKNKSPSSQPYGESDLSNEDSD